jgi:hypothetical protein
MPLHSDVCQRMKVIRRSTIFCSEVSRLTCWTVPSVTGDVIPITPTNPDFCNTRELRLCRQTNSADKNTRLGVFDVLVRSRAVRM